MIKLLLIGGASDSVHNILPSYLYTMELSGAISDI